MNPPSFAFGFHALSRNQPHLPVQISSSPSSTLVLALAARSGDPGSPVGCRLSGGSRQDYKAKRLRVDATKRETPDVRVGR